MQWKNIVVIGFVVLAICFGWKILCALWSGVCWLATGVWSLVCACFSWIWHAVLTVLFWVLYPAYLVAETVLDGSGWAWCVGLAAEAVLVGVVIGAISRVSRK